VVDNGVGIDTKDIPRVLAPFGQVDSAFKRSHQGTGLGLPLVKSLVELHGGTFDIQSEVDVGTVVTVRLPHRESEPAAAKAEPTRAAPAAPAREYAAAFTPALGHSAAD
jgi:signal transduction histidine kinase